MSLDPDDNHPVFDVKDLASIDDGNPEETSAFMLKLFELSQLSWRDIFAKGDVEVILINRLESIPLPESVRENHPTVLALPYHRGRRMLAIREDLKDGYGPRVLRILHIETDSNAHRERIQPLP